VLAVDSISADWPARRQAPWRRAELRIKAKKLPVFNEYSALAQYCGDSSVWVDREDQTMNGLGPRLAPHRAAGFEHFPKDPGVRAARESCPRYGGDEGATEIEIDN